MKIPQLLTAVIFNVIFLFNFSQVLAKEYDCEVIQYKKNCIVEKNKLAIETTCYYQINNRQGDEHASISIPYTKGNKISIVDAWIEDANGTIIRKLKNSDITDVSAISDISLYEDRFIRKFSLRHNSYPYRIYYKTRLVLNEFIEITEWCPVIDTEIPTRYAELTVEVPKGYEIRIYQDKISYKNKTENDKSVLYEWKENNIKPLKDEILSPPHANLIPRVIVVPVYFEWYIKGSFRSWLDFGNWYYGITKGLDNLPQSEIIRITPLVQGIEDQKEVVKKLYYYLQDQTRYINVSIKYGGLKPYPAEYVAQNKYGDCKALSNYMISLLKAFGIPSYLTLVYADDNPVSFIDSFPSDQFNHVMVAVPLEKDTILLETTSQSIPFGYVGEFTRDRKGLIIKNDNSRLINLPQFTSFDQQNYRSFEFKVKNNGSCEALLNFKLHGSNFEMYNSINNDYSKTNQERILRDYLLNFPSFEITDWNLNKPNRNTAEIKLNVRLNLQNFSQAYGNEKAISYPVLSLPNLETPGKRTLPIKINTPINYTDSIFINFNQKIDIAAIPDDISLNSEYGSYSIKVKTGENKILILRNYTLNSGMYALDEYTSFYNFIQSIKNADRKKILIRQ